jgi:cytochrome c oxidase assembly factor CtaG
MTLATARWGGPEAILLPLVLLAYWWPYARRTRTLAAEGRPVPGWRRWCFASGVVTIAIALSPPIGYLSDQLLSFHMVEHLLIGDIGALLLVLGLTGPVLAPLLRIRAVDRLRALLHPAVAVPLWALSLYLWHIPGAYQLALRHDLVHAVEHACFLGFGMAMWMALLGPFPKPAWFNNFARLGYVIAVRMIGTVLANVFLWSGTVFYPYYAGGERHFGVGRLADQSTAGAVMMVEESLLTLGLFCWLFMRAARQSEERQALLDYAQAHGLELSEARAARAVAAGQSDRLRRRLEDDAT